MESSSPYLSPLDYVMRFLVTLEHGSIGIEGVLPVDHTPTIKSVRTYKIR